MSRSSNPVPLKLAARYELMRTQATDANTASLLAWDTRLKRWRSIRVARPGDEAASRRMLAVAQWAAKLEHPALERVIDVGTDGTVVYVVRDRLVGSVSDHLRRRGAVSAEWALQVVTRCAEGLAWAHPRGIVHGHPRPDVVQFSEDGSAVLTSFGQRAVLRDTPETRAGADWAHLAPELRQAWAPDAATDVYALGALLYMLLAGKPSADLFYAEAYEGLLSAVPRNLRPLLHRACAFAPAERMSTQELHDELRRAQGEFETPRAPAPWLDSTQDFPDRNQYDGLDAILTEIAPHLDTPQPKAAFGVLESPSEPPSTSFHDEPTVPPGTVAPVGNATPPSAPRRPEVSNPRSGPLPSTSGPYNTGRTPPSSPRYSEVPSTPNYVAPPPPPSGPNMSDPGGTYPGYVMPSPMLDDHIPGTPRADDTFPSGGESFMGVKYYDAPSEGAPVLPASPVSAPGRDVIKPASRDLSDD
ncbi:MAG: protein kinase, partial [Myxococcota bacterium]